MTALIVFAITPVTGQPKAEGPHSVTTLPELLAPLPGSSDDGNTWLYTGGVTSEKSIKADGNVNISLCVTQGSIKVNGWNRDEVRVFIEDGSKFGFKVQQKSAKTGEPVWIMIEGTQPKGKFAEVGECLWGEIEIDVPRNATVNIKGRETSTTIDSVRKASLFTIGGDISLRNITNGITASAGQGDITVEHSQGAMILNSTTGNILVFEAGPSEIGDMFKAKTNGGAISLQSLTHRQVEVDSVSGSVAYMGDILNGGSYTLRTSKGSIRMTIPTSAAFKVSATFGQGTFNTDLPFKIETENISEGPVKSIVGIIGKGGDALVKLNSNYGTIAVKKQ